MHLNTGISKINERGYYLHFGFRMRKTNDGNHIWIGDHNPTTRLRTEAAPNGIGVWVLDYSRENRGTEPAVKDGFKTRKQGEEWANKEYNLDTKGGE